MRLLFVFLGSPKKGKKRKHKEEEEEEEEGEGEEMEKKEKADRQQSRLPKNWRTGRDGFTRLASRILSDPTSKEYLEWRRNTIKQAKLELEPT